MLVIKESSLSLRGRSVWHLACTLSQLCERLLVPKEFLRPLQGQTQVGEAEERGRSLRRLHSSPAASSACRCSLLFSRRSEERGALGLSAAPAAARGRHSAAEGQLRAGRRGAGLRWAACGVTDGSFPHRSG